MQEHGVFDLVFLHNFEICSVKLSLFSILTHKSLLGMLLFMIQLLIVIEVSSLDVSKRFELSGYALR